MTIPILHLLFSLNLYANQNVSQLAQTAGIIGGSMGVANNALMGMMTEELEDWKDASGTTGSFVDACTTHTEFRLLRGTRTNYVFVAIHNYSVEDIDVYWGDLLAEFGSGILRRAELPSFSRQSVVRTGWRDWLLVPLPTKSDFMNQSMVKLSIPILRKGKDCLIEAVVRRDTSKPFDVESYSSRTSFDFTLDLGPSIFQSDNISDSGSTTLNMDFSGFNSLHHGSYMNINFDGSGTVKSTKVFSDELLAKFSKPTQSAAALGLGYVNRQRLSEYSYLYINGGISLYSVFLNDSNTDEGVSRRRFNFSTFSADFGLAFDTVFSRVITGLWRGDYAWGFKLKNSFFNPVKKTDVDFKGMQSTLLFRFRMGI